MEPHREPAVHMHKCRPASRPEAGLSTDLPDPEADPCHLEAVSVCGAYAGLAIYAKQTGWQYPYAGGATFGFLPNRNHTATFLIVGSVLSLGLLRIAWRGCPSSPSDVPRARE